METALQVQKSYNSQKRLGNILHVIYKHRVSYMFLLPFAVIFIAFTIVPVIMSMGLSLTYYNILEPPKWVGWKNYINLLVNDDIFLIAVKNTFLFVVITGPLSILASLIFAWLINEFWPKLRAVLIVAIYAPTISGQAYMIWSIMFSGDSYGYINGMLIKLGLINEPVQWLTDGRYILTVLIIVTLWMSLGQGFLALVAGLQGVDASLYEAGYVDGIRNRWQELWFITLPSIKPQLMFATVLAINQSFAVYEVSAALAGFPSTDYAGHTIVSHLVDYGYIRFDMGYASAIATILFIAIIITNKLMNSLLNKIGR